MQNNWIKELNRVLATLLLCAFAGFVSGYFWQALAIGGILYIAWTLWQLKRIHDWLINDSSQDPPETIGFWGGVCDKIYHLQQSEQRVRRKLEADVAYLRDSFASLTDAVVLLNPHGMIDWCNDISRSLLGLRAPDDFGQYLLNLLRDPAFVHFYEQGDYQQGIEVVSPRDPDRRLLVQISRFGEGNRLIFARDITDVYMLEQMRRDFVSNVSHELRTPLTVISGYIDNFSMFVSQVPRMEKPLQQMAQHAQRMEAILRDLLALSRLETLPNEMHKTRVSLSDLTRMVVEEARCSLDEGQYRQITVDIQSHISVFGQETELHSALLNLVLNACKYTLQDGEISVRCYMKDGFAVFSVVDNGIGIDPLEIPRLTERFYRVDKSRSINTGGTGLGLAIVKRVMQRHEAELKIHSQQGKGSTFSCYFPPHRIAAVD